MKTPIFVAVAAVLGLAMAPVMAQESRLSPAIASDSSPDLIAQLSTTASVPDKKKFELSTEQLEKLHALKNQYSTANSAKKAELKTLKGQLRDVLTAVSVDKSQALSLQGKINAIKADLANSRVSFMADASTVFTTEQRQQMHRRALMRGMGGHRHHGGGGGCGGGFRGGKGHHGGGHGGFHGKRGFGGPGGPGGPAGSASIDGPDSTANTMPEVPADDNS